MEIAVYGKGGIGKSTISANVTTALAKQGVRVLQIGCDPKHDSTRLLMHGKEIQTVLDYLKDHDKHQGKLEEVLYTGAYGIGCVEAGGPKPGVGCAGRGIISAFEFLEIHHAKEAYDTIVYDVLGDVVCGGFAVPVRREYADAVFLVTSGEYMALYAANNILRGICNYDRDIYKRVAGIIFNERKLADEEERVMRFAAAVDLPVVARVPRSEAFAIAEREKCTAMELDGFPEVQEVFASLADRICGDLPLYAAKPLSDDELEQVVLQPGRNGQAALQPGKTGQAVLETGRNEQAVLQAGGSGQAVLQAGSTGQAGRNERDTLQTGRKEKAAWKDAADNAERFKGQTAENTEKRWQTDAGQRTVRKTLYGCAFNGAATSAVHLTDAHIIAHSPRSCAFFTWQNISSSGRKNLFNRGILMPSAISPNFSCTEIGQTEAVFGGTEKVREAVLEARKEKPGAVIVISSCVSGIIGDDVRSLEELSTPEMPVIIMEADGVIGGDYMEGIRLSLHRIAEKLIDPEVKPSGRCVNLINEAGVSNNVEVNYRIVENLLKQLDIRINARFLGDTTCDRMKNFLAAPLNILAADSPDGRELQTWLEEKYHCQFAQSCLPVGFRETKRWLYEIAEEFDCVDRVPAILEKEEARYREELEKLRPYLKGKRLLMTTINTNMDWLLETADDLGMEVTWIGVLNYLQMPLHISNHDRFQRLATEEVSVPIIQEQIQKTKADIVLSNYVSLIGEGDFVKDSLSMTQVIGFRSGLHVLEHWVELLKKKAAENAAAEYTADGNETVQNDAAGNAADETEAAQNAATENAVSGKAAASDAVSGNTADENYTEGKNASENNTGKGGWQDDKQLFEQYFG
ncbi:MAG: nitrogenase component 1 [Eubacteriales bacterium]|nr:nitrogenase component 1 [Eubacteriales bacterium]